MQVTVFKCDVTGQLFEDEKDYKAHKRQLKREAEAQTRREEAKQALQALRDRASSVADVASLMELLNQYALQQAQLNGSTEVKELRLAQISVAGRSSRSLDARVLVLTGGSGSSFSSFSSSSMDGIPGVRFQSGGGASVPSDAPAGTTRAMTYQVTFEFDKLTGLAKTRDDILAAREAETAHLNALRTQADEMLYSESSSFRELQEEGAQLNTELELLRDRLDRYTRMREENLRKIGDAVQAKHDELVTLHNEPTERRKELEALMKVGSV